MAENQGNTASYQDMADLVNNLAKLMREVNKNKNIKAKEPDYYYGDRDAVKIDGWISAVENYSRAQEMDDEELGIYALGLLKDKADTWYRTIEKPAEGETSLGWLELKRGLVEFFCPENFELIARDKIAKLTQTGDVNSYINNFMDLKLAIKNMTDEEACDKFMRGLTDVNTAAYVRQYYDGTLRTATKSALTFDSAHSHDMGFRPPIRTPVTRTQYVSDPMDLDWIDDRQRNNGRNGSYHSSYNNQRGGYGQRGGYNNQRGNYNNSRGGNNSGSSGRCFFCNKNGHIKRFCKERLNAIKKLDDTRSHKNRYSVNLIDMDDDNGDDKSKNNSNKLIDFDPYVIESSETLNYPTLTPQTNTDKVTSPQYHFPNITELRPIVYPTNDLHEEFNHLLELNTLGTTLPLYKGNCYNNNVQVLIDSGASENYVSPHIIPNAQELIPVFDRKVETAGGEISEIKYKVNLKVDLNGYYSTIMAYVFPTKFDLILGRSWLKQEKPKPDWDTDTWSINQGSTLLKPQTNTSINHSPLTSISDLSYLISHKQADRYLKKGANGFLLCIRDIGPQHDIAQNGIGDDTYWESLIQDFGEIFKTDLPGLPPDRGIEHIINTGDARPISRPPFKMSPLELDELKKQIQELLKLGLIKPSSSPWGAPVLFVRKKPDPGSTEPGKLRMCIDYRALNKLTIRDSSSIPRPDECLERLSGAKYFTSIDLKSGYHQLRIAEEDVDKTAFNTRYGKFAFLVLPFGLSNAPPTFQRLMNNVLADCLDKFALVYLDDILIWSDSLEDHKKHVRHVLELLRKEKLIVNRKKCNFGKKELTFVGFHISRHGVKPSPEKVEVLEKWPKLTNVQEVRQFIGFAQFYKRFIKNFASIAAPLTDLTRGTGHKKRPIIWSPECQTSFDTLKKVLMSNPVLKIVDMNKPFKIEVDASDRGCGAVLYQPDDDPTLPWHPICFESKKFTLSESRMPAQEKELLGIIHALRKWRCYVDGCPAGYTVYSDHMPLQYFRTKENPPSRLVRWINEIEAMGPNIVYKAGKDNEIADVLSRMNYASEDMAPEEESLEPDMLYAAWDTLPPLVRTDWPLLLLSRDKVKSQEINNLLNKEQHNFSISSNRIYRHVKFHKDDQIHKVPYLPFEERADKLARYHESLGHAGITTTLHYMQTRFWWPSMKQDIIDWLKLCPSCQLNSRKGLSHKDVMHPLKVPSAFDRWHLDFLDLPTSTKGNRWLLIGVDYATNWCVARAMPTASAENVADFLYEEIVMNFGTFSELVTDRGSNFCSLLMKEYQKRVGINHKLTSAYHPRTNSKVERFNGIIKPMLRKFTNGAIHRWDDFVHAALWACRIRVHSTTGFSPYYLTYGRQPRLPGDIMRPYIDATVFKDPRTIADFTSRELAALGQDRAAAEFRMKAMAGKDKARWDAAIKPLSFEVGDMVMLTNEGKYGLEPTFKGPYMVVKNFPDYGTYKLETMAGEPLKSLVHVDRLKSANGPKPDEPWFNPTESRKEWRNFEKESGTQVLQQKIILPPVENDVTDFIDPIEPTPQTEDLSKEKKISTAPMFTTIQKQPSSTMVNPVPENHNAILPDTTMSKSIEPSNNFPNFSDVAETLVDLPESNVVGSPSSGVQGRTQSLGGANVRINPANEIVPVQESGTENYYDVMELTRPKRRFKPTKITKPRPNKKTKLLVIRTNKPI